MCSVYKRIGFYTRTNSKANEVTFMKPIVESNVHINLICFSNYLSHAGH